MTMGKTWVQALLLASVVGRHLVQAVSCPSGVQPLLWKIAKGTNSAYLAATYNIKASMLEPLASVMQEAMSCADIAYFPTGCSLADKSTTTGVGSYMDHCSYYPVVDDQDTIADRLSPSSLSQLQAAVGSLATSAPQTCSTAASTLQTSVSNIADNVTYRTTLLELYHQSIEAINPLWCATATGTENFDSYMRSKWGTTKPIFGLEDIGVECQVYQGNTVSQDQELASTMIKNFNDAAWVNNVSNMQASMEDVMKCGNLQTSAQLTASMENLPLASERNLQTRNNNLKFGVEAAMSANPGKTLFFVVPVTHLVDAGSKKGVVSLLTEDGVTVTRVTSGESLSCQASTYSAPGASALGHCLKPPAQSQPASCIQFEQQFDQILGKDVLHGRTKVLPPSCQTCINSTTPCDCEVQWGNIDGFKNLCEETQVDGSYGKVYYLDLTRNPGSTRVGTRLAQKTVIGMYQNCYATSCDIPIIQQMATRNWYKSDPALAVGSISVRPLGEPFLAKQLASGSSGPFPWYVWVFIACAVAICILGLIKLFHFNPPPKKGRQMDDDGDFMDRDLKQGDFSSELQPLKPSSPVGDSIDLKLEMPSDARGQAMDLRQMPTAPSGIENTSVPQMSQMPALPSMQQNPAGMNAPAMPAAQASLPYQASMQVPSYQPPSLQGYQASAPSIGSPVQMPSAPSSYQPPSASYQPASLPSSPTNSLLAQAMQMSAQIESSGAQAMWSMTNGQAYQMGQAGQTVPVPSALSYAPQLQTPSYQFQTPSLQTPSYQTPAYQPAVQSYQSATQVQGPYMPTRQ